MGLKLQNVDESNVMAVIYLHRSSNILSWIPGHLITREVCLASVQANGLAVKGVPDKLATKEILLTAIKESHQALWVIRRPLIDEVLVDAAFESLINQCKAARYYNL